jgi:hypothetical protein
VHRHRTTAVTHRANALNCLAATSDTSFTLNKTACRR